MKTVNKIYFSSIICGLIIFIAFSGLGFMEPWASVYKAYGLPYWFALMVFVGGLVFMPLINYITLKAVTIKYGLRKIVTAIKISGFFVRYVLIIIGVLMFAIVFEDYLSLFFAEIFLKNGNYLASNGSVVWSAMIDLGKWLGLGELSIIYITPDFRIPLMYIVFMVIGLILVVSAILVPRFWYKPITKKIISKI